MAQGKNKRGGSVHVALLRGINVGGKNKLPMKELAAMFTEAGARDVQTYIQSGNVVFTASAALAKRLPDKVGSAISKRFGFEIPVVTRTAHERGDGGLSETVHSSEDIDGLSRSRSILSGIRLFFLTRPPIPTLIRCSAEEDREDYTVRIQQRLGIDVRDYRVLNIHRIGVDAPVSYVFDEILAWDGETPAWPNRIATVEQMDARREHIRIVLLGGLKQLFGNGKLFAHGLGTLFKLEAVRVKRVPDAEEMDNARYLLFDCHGGYPIGIFSIYARSSTAAQGETDATQVFMVDGFNFYGVRWWPGVRVFNRLWEAVHNRVTNNVLNRFKQLCETRFLNVTAGREPTISRG